MILVDDEIARSQVCERLQRTPAEAPLARNAAAKDLMVGQEHEPELAPDETAPCRLDREEESGLARKGVAGLEQLRLDAAEHPLRAQRFAAMRERDDDALPGSHERRKLHLGLREPARGDRRPLRFERERLALRERIELGGALERDRRQAVLGPDAAHVVRLEDEVGRALERGDEIGRDGPRLVLLAVPLVDEVEAALGGREDRARVDRVQRTLRERREGADRLDLVAEELDAERLPAGGREDVDQAAAHRELPAVVDALDALVAGERELFGEALDADLQTGSELERGGSRRRGRQQLGHRMRRRTDEAAACEHGERTSALADEVRRRLEAGLPANTSRRQIADRLFAEEPRCRLGRVARVRVLRQQADERPLEPLVQRGKHERERRLRDARTRRQRLNELSEPLMLRNLANECVEYGTVHDGYRRLTARCACSRPSASSCSTASAARAISVAASSCGSKLERT